MDRILVSGVTKRFYPARYLKRGSDGRRLRREQRLRPFEALKAVSLSVSDGEIFGVVGSNGSGKTTLLKCIAGLLPIDEGTIAVDGRVATLLELGSGFHPDLTGRENIVLNAQLLGSTRRDAIRRIDEIAEFSGIGAHIDQPVHTYSSGMHARLAFSIATTIEPEILLIDEILAVGDHEFAQRSSSRIRSLVRDGRTVVLVSHALPFVQTLCSRAAWIGDGEVRMIGPPREVVQAFIQSFESDAWIDEDGHRHRGTGRAKVFAAVTSRPNADGSLGIRARIVVDAVGVRHVTVTSLLAHERGLIVSDERREYAGGERFRLVYEVSRAPLAPGRYRIEFGVIDDSGDRDVIPEAHWVEVPGMRAGDGIVALRPHWSDAHLAVPPRTASEVRADPGRNAESRERLTTTP